MTQHMHREVVAKRGDNMAIIDSYRDLFGTMKYRAGVLKIKMVPQTWCETVGTYKSEAEARTEAEKALQLPNGEQ